MKGKRGERNGCCHGEPLKTRRVFLPSEGSGHGAKQEVLRPIRQCSGQAFVLLLQNFAQNDKVEVRTLSAVLLAGGESRRMGRDKATIEFDGDPLWRRQLQILRDLAPEKIFVSVRTQPFWLPDDAALLLDNPPSRGPLGGLTKALEQMQTTHLVALAVDMPFMTAEQLRVLCGLAGQGCGVTPMIGERAEPLAAVYSRESGLDFAAALAGRDFSLQKLVRELIAAGKMRIFPVPEKDEHLYLSLNEPADIKERRFTNRRPKNDGGLETAAP
jgi:molybdopterin-guanine dinucleotide biosynthesis protein A